MWLSRTLQHHFNPLHLFCRLRRLGLGKNAALRLARLYERYLYRA
jgi:hypothetical protein